MVLDEILSIRYLHLYQLSRQFITNDPRKGLNDSIELFVEGGDVESAEFQGKIIETKLWLLEVGDLFLLCFWFAAIEEADDETAKKINANDYVQQMLTPHLIQT